MLIYILLTCYFWKCKSGLSCVHSCSRILPFTQFNCSMNHFHSCWLGIALKIKPHCYYSNSVEAEGWKHLSLDGQSCSHEWSGVLLYCVTVCVFHYAVCIFLNVINAEFMFVFVFCVFVEALLRRDLKIILAMNAVVYTTYLSRYKYILKAAADINNTIINYVIKMAADTDHLKVNQVFS